MERIQLANVACGWHAGSPEQMMLCAELGQRYGVKLGMHPGVRENKGRGELKNFSVCNFYDHLEAQHIMFEKYIGEVKYIKLHGSLYHLSESREDITEALLEFAYSSKLKVIALAGGSVWKNSAKAGVECLAEAFLDRHYLPNGQLVARDKEGAELKTVEEIENRWSLLQNSGQIEAQDGSTLKLQVDTVCVHSDSVLCREAIELFRRDK